MRKLLSRSEEQALVARAKAGDRVAYEALVRDNALLASLRRMLDTLQRLAAPPPESVADGVIERLRRDA